MLVGLWAFWIYIAAALILRTWSENQRTIGPDLLLERAAKSLEQAFQDLQSTTAAAITPNFADTNAHLQKAINALPSGPAKDYVESTKRAGRESSGISIEYINGELKRALRDWIRGPGQKTDKEIEAELALIEQRIIKVIGDVHSVDETRLIRAEQVADTFDSAVRNFGHHLNDLQGKIKTFEGEAKSIISAQQDRTHSLVSLASAELNKARKEIRSVRRVAHLDRNATSLIVPIVASVLLVLTTLLPPIGGAASPASHKQAPLYLPV